MKKFNSSKIFFYTGNHNKIAGIADIIDYFKNLCEKNNIKLTLSSKLPKSINETFVVVEEFSKTSQYLKINQKLDSLKSKKNLVLTEFFDHKDNNLNSFMTPKKFKFFIKTFGILFLVGAFLSNLFISLKINKFEANQFLKFKYELLRSLFLSPIHCFKGTLHLIKYLIFFFLFVIQKLIQSIMKFIYLLFNPISSLKFAFFLIDILNKYFFNPFFSLFSKKIFFKKIEEFKSIEKYMINLNLKYNSILFIKYLKLFFEKYNDTDLELSDSEYKFYKKILWVRQFIINNVLYYNVGLNNDIRTGLSYIIRPILNGLLYITRPILNKINNFYFIKKFILHKFLLINQKINTFREYLHNYVYFKIRYINLMKCINKFDYILRTHEQIKIDKDIIDVENDVIFFSQFDTDTLNNNFRVKKINFDFSGQFNTYRHKKIKEIIENFRNFSNVFSTEKLEEIILIKNNNEFISSKKSRETKFSLHIEKSEIWPYSSPARYINSLQKNEIPIIIKDFGDLYSINMAINLKNLIKNHLNIDEFIKEYFNKIKIFKKQMNLNDNKIAEYLR